MSVLKLRRESGKAHEGKPRSEPERGNPAFRDRRGACANVAATGVGLRPIGKPMEWPPDPYGCKRAAFLSRLALAGDDADGSVNPAVLRHQTATQQLDEGATASWRDGRQRERDLFGK